MAHPEAGSSIGEAAAGEAPGSPVGVLGLELGSSPAPPPPRARLGPGGPAEGGWHNVWPPANLAASIGVGGTYSGDGMPAS